MDNVAPREVRQYYARWELEKREYEGSGLRRDLNTISDDELATLLRELSRIRQNEMADLLLAINRRWIAAQVATSDLRTGHVNGRVNAVIDRVAGRISELAHIWNEDKGPDGEALRQEFRRFQGPAESERVICVPDHGSIIRVADGIHRAVGLAVNGKSALDCYIGTVVTVF